MKCVSLRAVLLPSFLLFVHSLLAVGESHGMPGVFGYGMADASAGPVAMEPGDMRIRVDLESESNSEAWSENVVEPLLTDFGVALVTIDRETIREVSAFSSLVDIAWHHPEFSELVVYGKSYGMKSLISLHDLFFLIDETSEEPRPPWVLRRDYRARWSRFVGQHREALGFGTVWAFYLVDEPFWNNIVVDDLLAAQRVVKETFPLIPVMTTMSRQDIDAAPLDLPSELFDVVGYHVYGVPQDPNIDPDYQRYLRLFQDRFPFRDTVIVADAWWREARHGAAGLSREILFDRASQYRQVAEDIGAIAVGAFVWQSFADAEGLRTLPENVLREYIRVGSEISGSCGIPADVDALAGETILAFQDCRFQATARWRDPETGTEGSAVAVPLTQDTGVFWFFDESNIEMTVKLLDGRALNGHWWVYWSEMTSLDVVLEITDRQTGAVSIYREPAQDTSAFVEAIDF